MAITTYGQLKSAIQSWMLDLSDVGSNVDDCITLGHAYIFTKLRVRKMVTRVTLTPTGGEYTLPTDFVQARRVTELTSPRRPLEYITPKAAEYLYPTRQSGLGFHFTTEGDKLLVFPYAGSDVELSYYAEAPAMSEEGDSNWLLLKFPALYLAAGQMYAADFLKEDGEVTKQATIADTYIDLLNSQHLAEEYQSAEYTFLGDAP
jgi:hypothetical protein